MSLPCSHSKHSSKRQSVRQQRQLPQKSDFDAFYCAPQLLSASRSYSSASSIESSAASAGRLLDYQHFWTTSDSDSGSDSDDSYCLSFDLSNAFCWLVVGCFPPMAIGKAVRR
mgnify:CR=1 FL=1